MAYLNKVMIIGNLTRDPELKVLPSGKTVANLCLAASRRYRDEAGNEKEEVCFVDVTAWGKTAELCAKWLAKGRQCFVEGRLTLDQWETKEGEKRQRLKVTLENVQFLGAKPGGAPVAAQEEGAAERPIPAGPKAAADLAAAAHVDDDVPF